MIIGQEKAINYLTRIIAEDKISNSFLFFGPAGVGKKTASYWFSKKINCSEANEKMRPCGKCSACVKIDKRIHPDVVTIAPDGNYIKIEQTRQILDTILFRPFEGKYKVYIFEDAQALTDAAANQLLKVLEEPPPYAVLVLIINDVTNLPPTVFSRCQRVPFGYVEEKIINDYISENFDFEPEKLASLVKLSAGSIGKAASLAKDAQFWKAREFALKAASVASSLNYAEALTLATKVEEFKDYEEAVLEFLIDWFRDLLILKQMNDFKAVINYDMKDALSKNAQDYSAWQIKKTIRQILEARKLLRRNVNKKIIFNNLFLKLAEPHAVIN